jgi:DNA repair protein RadA
MTDESGEPKDAEALETLDGVGPKTAQTLREAGYQTVSSLRLASLEDLSALKGIGKKTLQKILEALGRADEAGAGEDSGQEISEPKE